MKLGIDSYCFHRFFGEIDDGQSVPAQPMSVDDFLAYASELGVQGVSLESCFLPSMEEAWFRNLKAKLDDYGFERVYAWGHPSGLEDGSNREAFDDMMSQIRNAALIGASVMRVTPGPGPTNWRETDRKPRMAILAGWYSEAVQVAQSLGVKLAAENHGDYTSDEMLWLVEAVGSPCFGVTFDTGNFLRVMDEPVRAMKNLAPHTLATHLKDVAPRDGASPADGYYLASTVLGEGRVDVPAVVRMLKDAHYDGLLAVEIDYLHPRYGADEHAAVRRSIQYLRSVVAGMS